MAEALVNFAVGNRVNGLVQGAATHGLKLQRLLATMPIKIAMAAPCTVRLVKQALPFELLRQPCDPWGLVCAEHCSHEAAWR